MAGLDEAVTRANGALAAGADVVFVEAPQTLEEIAAIPKKVNGPLRLLKTPNVGESLEFLDSPP